MPEKKDHAREAAMAVWNDAVTHYDTGPEFNQDVAEAIIQSAIDAALAEERAEVRERAKRLEAYEPTFKHPLSCGVWNDGRRRDCTCGLDAARKELGL